MADEREESDLFEETDGLLDDLRKSGIEFVLQWTRKHGVKVTIRDEKSDVSHKQFFTKISDAIDWLRDQAVQLYPNSGFARMYEPRYQSPYQPGSREAQAAGCTCPWGGAFYDYLCPEHGTHDWRDFDDRLLYVGDNWRPGRPLPNQPDHPLSLLFKRRPE